MMVHQMAAVHRQIMKLTARMDDIALMQFPHHEGFQQKNVEVCRLGATMARLTACFQSGLLALQRVRAGGRQVVTVAACARSRRAAKRFSRPRSMAKEVGGRQRNAAGGRAEMASEPHVRMLLSRLELANASPRCGARTRRGDSCEGPAMANGRCRFHGGKSTGREHLRDWSEAGRRIGNTAGIPQRR
jgi:hypothetical protein